MKLKKPNFPKSQKDFAVLWGKLNTFRLKRFNNRAEDYRYACGAMRLCELFTTRTLIDRAWRKKEYLK